MSPQGHVHVTHIFAMLLLDLYRFLMRMSVIQNTRWCCRACCREYEICDVQYGTHCGASAPQSLIEVCGSPV